MTLRGEAPWGEPTFYERVQDFVRRVSYKDWTFELYDVGVHHADLFIGPPGHSVPNSYGERDWLQKFYAPCQLRSDQLEREWIRAIHVTILALEDHEIFEWFKLDGRAAINPHPAMTAMDRPYSKWAAYDIRRSRLQEIEGE
jgi:hypothetical protein